MIVVVGGSVCTTYVRMSIFLTLMIGQNCSLLVPDWLGEVHCTVYVDWSGPWLIMRQLYGVYTVQLYTVTGQQYMCTVYTEPPPRRQYP